MPSITSSIRMSLALMISALATTGCAVEGSATDDISADRSDGAYAQRAARPSYVRSRGFFVQNGRLYDKHGNDFVIRGINNPHIWFDTDGRDLAYNALEPIAGYGANTVRIVWNTSGDPALLRRIVQRTVELEMIPMVELHDATGSPDNQALLDTAAYYTRSDVKSVLTDYEDYLLVNIANEWSGSDFRGGYSAAIRGLRDAGIHHTLVIDANGWGQNVQSVLDHGQALLDADPQTNLLFSVHMYELFADRAAIERALGTAVQKRLPLIVGEFGFQHGNPVKSIDFRAIMAECQRLGLGYLAWSWKGNSSGVEYLDMSNDWEGTSLTRWGSDVLLGANGISGTARPASVFTGGTPTQPTQPPAGGSTPVCTANSGRGWGSVYTCGAELCAKADQSYQTACVISGAPTAPNGIPYCLSNSGQGYGTLFQCGDQTCAKTDQTYRDYCVVL